MLKANNITQPKAKYSNNIILTMLENLDNDFIADIEPSRNGFINRGSLVECIIKYVAYNTPNVSKSCAFQSDLNTLLVDKKTLKLFNNVRSSNIEIKFSTSFAPATAKTSKARKTIIISENSIVMLDSKNLVKTKAGKISLNNQKVCDLVVLNDLMERLGYNA